MSLAEATLRSAHFARWNWAKLCVFAALFGLLFYVGQQGRQQVDRQVQLAEVVALADQSLILIDEQLVGGGKGSQAISLALVAQAIGSRIAEFETKNRTLSKEEEQLDLRCARAASLIAGQRPAEALAQLGEDAESGATDSDRKRRVLRLRGEALFAQQAWAEAAKRFEQIIAAKPRSLAAGARAAECHFRLGDAEKAWSLLDAVLQRVAELGTENLQASEWAAARTQFERIHLILGAMPAADVNAATWRARAGCLLGATSMLQHDPAAAASNFGKAIEFKAPQFSARAHASMGDLLLMQGKPADALVQFQKAHDGSAGFSAAEMAMLELRLGTALLAAQDFAGAVERLAGLTARGIDLPDRVSAAVARNNLGVSLGALGRREAAISAFSEAIRITESAGPSPETNGPAAERNAGDDLLRVDLLALWSEDGIDVQGRPMPRAGAAEMRQARVLASALENRARTLLLEGKTHECIADLSRAADLPGSPALKDFAAHQARALASLGWIYAAHPEPAIRNPAKAKEIARKACNLSEWKTHGPVEALAAAHAQAGEYPQAVQWQETALALAPAGARPKASERLQKYRTRNPPILELESRPPRS